MIRLYLNRNKYNGEATLKTVNLDQNTKLKEVEIVFSREDKTINLSHLTSLELLDIYQSRAKNVILPNNVKTIKLVGNGIENITLPEGIVNVNLNINKITNIVIPSSVRKLELEGNNITNIDLPEEIELVNLNYNYKITNLHVPNSVKYLNATRNKISNIILPNGIKVVDLSENKLTNIDLPEGVEIVNLSENKLTSLVIPSSVKKLYARHNNISNDIIVPNGIENLYLNDNKISKIILSESSQYLKEVELSENNISNIDLNNSTNIESLTLYKNPLKNINVTKLLKLKYLYLSETKLESNIDLKNNVELKSFSISGKEESEEPRVENFDFSSNIKLEVLTIGDRNLKNFNNFNLDKSNIFSGLYLENNIINYNLDLSNFNNLKSIKLRENKLTNITLPKNCNATNYNNCDLSVLETIELKVKKNSYVTIPKTYVNNKEIYLRDYPYLGVDDKSYFIRNGEKYVFNKVGKSWYLGLGREVNDNNFEKNVMWRYKIEVEAGEEDRFNPVFNQGNYTPLINEEIPVNNLKEMITNLPANIKSFEVLSPNTFADKGDKTVKVRITFSDDTFKEVDIPIKVYEKEDILPTVTVNPETLEVLEKKPVNINITRSYAKEDNIDPTNFIKTVRDNLVSYEYLNKANGLTYNSNNVTGVIDYLFTGTEEEHTFNITYKEQGKIYRVNKNITIKLLRDTDKDGTPDKDDDDKDGDGFSNAVEIARGSDQYNKDSFDNLIKQLEKLIEDTKNNPFDTKNKIDVDKLKNNFLPGKVIEKDNIKGSYSLTTSDSDLLKLINKVKSEIDSIKKEINKLRDKANFEELDKEIKKPIDNSYKELIDKIKEAKKLDRNISTQEEVDKITKEIKDLREKIATDKEELKKKIEELEQSISDNICKSEACNTLLKEAKDLYDKEFILKEEMFNMIKRIDDLLDKEKRITNPNTGIKTYSLIILLIIFVSYLVFKKKKKVYFKN